MDTIKLIGLALILVSGTLILVSLLKENSFFNLRKIIKEQLALFQHSKHQYLIFYALPLVLAVGLAFLYTAKEDFFVMLNTILSIILSILLAVLTILSAKDFSKVQDKEQRKNVKRVVKETINAISFVAILCVFLLLFDLVMIAIKDISVCGTISILVSALIYYAFIIILLCLLMIIKRISNIILFDLEVKKEL